MQTHTGRRAFTLLELVVVVTILALLAGAAVPVTTRLTTHRARAATKVELQLLADACAEHFRDTRALPGALEDLLVDPDRPGWSGPYLPGIVADDRSRLPGYLVDGWSRPYDYAAAGSVATIASRGADGRPDADDPRIELDVTPIRRARTLECLALVNDAVRAYNRAGSVEPLAGAWERAYEQLVAAGFLPRSPDFERDAWGDPFVPDPPEGTPVVRFTSRRLLGGAPFGSERAGGSPRAGWSERAAAATGLWPERVR